MRLILSDNQVWRIIAPFKERIPAKNRSAENQGITGESVMFFHEFDRGCISKKFYVYSPKYAFHAESRGYQEFGRKNLSGKTSKSVPYSVLNIRSPRNSRTERLTYADLVSSMRASYDKVVIIKIGASVTKGQKKNLEIE